MDLEIVMIVSVRRATFIRGALLDQADSHWTCVPTPGAHSGNWPDLYSFPPPETLSVWYKPEA